MKKYENLLVEIKNLKREYEKTFSLYSEVLSTKVYGLSYKPRFTDTFRSIKHYREVFEMINKFFEYKDFEFNEKGYILGFKSLHTIYEYYCLIKLLQGYQQQGYNVVLSECYDKYEVSKYDIDINEYRKINNTFYLRKPEREEEVVIYYHPKIYSKKLDNNNNISLIRRDGNSYYEPDYLIKYTKNGKSYYSIMDAKFSLLANVKEYYYQKLIYKYLINIGDINMANSTVINLSALCLAGENDWRLISNYSSHCIPKINLLVFSPQVGDEQIYRSCKELLIDFQEI